MDHNDFEHREIAAGYRTPCHWPVRQDGELFRQNVEGYVRIPRQVDGKKVFRLAHRVRFEAANGTAASVTDHLCRNRWCCNPEHLESVDNAINVRRGDCAKVDTVSVGVMREMHANGISQSVLAKQFGLSQSHVSRVVRGLYWSKGSCKHWDQRKGGTQNL